MRQAFPCISHNRPSARQKGGPTPSQGVHVFYSSRNAYMLYMLPLYCRIDLAVEHCCWHSNARATTQRIAAHPAAFLLPLVFEPGERLTWLECYLSTKGWLPAAATATGRGHACSCAARSTAAAAAAAVARVFIVWLVWMCKVWFSSCPGSESLPLRLQQSEFRGGQSPYHLSPIFHRHPSSGRGIFVVVLRQAGQIE